MMLRVSTKVPPQEPAPEESGSWISNDIVYLLAGAAVIIGLIVIIDRLTT